MPAGSAHDLALQDEADVRAGVARRVDQLRELVEARLRRALGVAVDVLAQDAEQPACLGERVARGRGDRLEAAARVGRELRRREPCRLALDGDHRQVVRDDVVQLARDRGPLLHRRLLADALLPSPPASRRARSPPPCACGSTRRRARPRRRAGTGRCSPDPLRRRRTGRSRGRRTGRRSGSPTEDRAGRRGSRRRRAGPRAR